MIDPDRSAGRTLPVLVKRDDVLHPLLSGNKGRKLFSALSLPEGRCSRVLSWGGNQSNAMVAVAAMCAVRGWRFDYWTVEPADAVSPGSNLGMAMQHGLRPHFLSRADLAGVRSAADLPGTGQVDEETLVVPRGGASPDAEAGVRVLADELCAFVDSDEGRACAGDRGLAVVLPAGTGTTALFLCKHAQSRFRVFAAPVARGVREQMAALQRECGDAGPLPELLAAPPHFARPSAVLWAEILRWRAACRTRAHIFGTRECAALELTRGSLR